MREVRVYLAALAVFPLVLLAVNNSWAFPPPDGFLDPWIYAGYHMHFKVMWHAWPNEYYGSRVPWTVLGYVVHRFFSPGASLIILALLLFYTSAYSLFYAIYRIFRNSVAAFVTACLLGTNAWFLMAIGWNYVDGPSIACTFASIAALVAATYERRFRTASVVWGAFSAVLVALYPLNVVLIPVEILLFLGLDRLNERRADPRSAALWCAGFAAGALVLGLLNWVFGGKFDYISATLKALHLLTPAATHYIYVVPWRGWLPDAGWLLVPAILFVAGIALITTRRKALMRLWRLPPPTVPADEACLLVLAVGLVVTVCGFLIMQVLQFSVLSLFFRANAILPFAYLVLGGFIAVALSRETRSWPVWLSLAGALVCLSPWFLGFLHIVSLPLPSLPNMFIGAVSEPAWTLAVAALLLGSLVLRYRAVTMMTVVVFSLLNVATLAPGSVVRLPQDVSYRDRALAIFATSKLIDSAPDWPIIWWDQKDPDAATFSSLAIMYLQLTPSYIVRGQRVIFIRTSGFENLLVDSPFSDHPLPLTQIRRAHVQRGATNFDLIFGTVK